MFKIEDDIPIPEGPANPRGKAGKPPTYPFGDMKPGQSFWVAEKKAPRALDAAKHYRARHKEWEYSFRWADAGIRIWRTS